MKARHGFAAGMAGWMLMLAPLASWAFDSGSAPTPASTSAPLQRAPHHGAERVPHPAAPQAATTGKAADKATGDGKLALQAPPLDHVIERQKLRYILADSGEADNDGSTDVSVRESRAPVLVPVGQLYALPWAFLHPSQAWRIFTPVVEP